jgi:hypothetical protein
MSSLISSLKHGGAGHSGLSDSSRDPFKLARRSVIARRRKAAPLLLSLFLFWGAAATPVGGDMFASAASKAAAEQCVLKLKGLEDFSIKHKPGQKQTTRFYEDEINSYLALDCSPNYHPSLKSLLMTFEENNIAGVAAIDFDRLGSGSTRFLPKIISFMFSGTHTLTARGQLLSKNGIANFHLEQARFDNISLPKSLVEEIISAVGRKQNPPFDPLQPSAMPYKIERVDVHPRYIIVYQ